MSAAPPPPSTADALAAVDLGSNSFHLIVAQADQGHLRVVDRLREPVRLAAGLDAENRLTPEARARALDCLARFGQRLRGVAPANLRVVGTNTLRQARNARAFLAEAEQALGHAIEIISGMEEARLIYLGVAHSVAHDEGRRLVVDIGGGSTELIVGEGFQPRHLESIYAGCVSMSQAHFEDGRLSKSRFDAAVLAARLQLQPHEAAFRGLGWGRATGASGTIRAVREVVRGEGWSDAGITPASLKRLRKALAAAGHVDKLKLKGLSDDRRPVFAGGAAVLTAVFEALEIEGMSVADGALREGLLYDLLGRIRHEDVREATVEALVARHRVDAEHGLRVQATALDLLDGIDGWLPSGIDRDWARQLLGWAARLHELGLVVAHSQYQKHGAYVLANGDLPGFSRQEQAVLAALVRGHRRKIPKGVFEDLGAAWGAAARRLCVLLRLAVLLHRGRGPDVPAVSIAFEDDALTLITPNDWLAAHPLTRADLEQEAAHLRAIGFNLAWR